MNYKYLQKAYLPVQVRIAVVLHYLLFVGLGAAIGCATPAKKTLWIAPPLRQYVELFLVESVAHGRPISLDDLVARFEALPEDTLGQCWQPGDGGTPIISINTLYWDGLNASEREILMLHELGHCILELDHLDSLNADGMPNSLMYYSMFGWYYYETNREAYLTQFFGHVRL